MSAVHPITEHRAAVQRCPLSANCRHRAGEVCNPLAYPWLTAPPFLNRWVATLARVSEILVEQLDFYRRARTIFTGWNDIREGMSGVITARLLAPGRDNGRASNRHPF